MALFFLLGCQPAQPLGVSIQLAARRAPDGWVKMVVVRFSNRTGKDLWVDGICPEQVHAGLVYSVRGRESEEVLIRPQGFGRVTSKGGFVPEVNSTLLGARAEVGLCLHMAMAPHDSFDTVIELDKQVYVWSDTPQGATRSRPVRLASQFSFQRSVPYELLHDARLKASSE